ncbi:ABC transporter ATP-binding protein [Kitasatospora sp. NPDC057500]|uniref:ABC transporter ATP-binding protein n=1 Tax=Kitasatospora sp. NPDC057500 TaxID=3346151 RepID=UPI00367B389A
MTVELHGLTKFYGRGKRHRAALDGLSMTARAGEVLGLLGPNGSGKTTALRCLLGMTRADGGTITVLGRKVPDQLPEISCSVGALIESSPVPRGLTARHFLQHVTALAGLPRQRVAETLELVGLADRADEAVTGYSLGMRQRLGIALALVHDPALVVLDEPANGLDPQGIRWLRSLLGQLRDEGRTVILSSHLLSEAQLVCDSVVVVEAGRTLLAGRVDELITPQADRALITCPDPDAGTRVLRDAGADAADADGTGVLDVRGIPVDKAVEALVHAGQTPLEVRRHRPSLEELFLASVSGDATKPESGA